MRIYTSELEKYGEFQNGDRVFQLTTRGSRMWGAYLADGSDTPEAREFRLALRKALRAQLADSDRRSVEVYADGDEIDADDWMVDVVEAD